MTSTASHGPVRAATEVVRTARAGAGADALSSRARFRIDRSEPVFAGHYPDFPIFPGVCVVECVHRAALATAPGAGSPLSLAALESARFVGAVFPGDVLTVDSKWTAVEGGWKCTATASTDRGDAAKVRLRYVTGGTK
ncbi:hypothetical protein [Streptomyces sp. NPDC051993]|uniref:3-hydroxyacyl-ACP dehydratase FabZ family protein n=1 Tax=Streptomyces sp. NPDC051993 TaxID=3155286 RepID=UPI0034427A70